MNREPSGHRIVLYGAIALILALLAAFAGTGARPVAEWSAPPMPGTTQTPLLLAAHEPDSVDVRWSCAKPADSARLDGSTGAQFVTRMGALAYGALSLTETESAWEVAIGGTPIASLQYESGSLCSFSHDRVEGWTTSVDGVEMAAGDAMQITIASLGGLDLNRFDGLQVIVDVKPHGFISTWWKTVLQLASVMVVGAVGLMLAGRRWPDIRNVLQRRNRTIVGVTVLSMLPLIVLLFVQPPFEDDGWVLTTVQNHRWSGQFGNYFLSWDFLVPLGALSYEVQRLLSAISTSPLLLRLPGLVAAAAMWVAIVVVLRRLSNLDANGRLTRQLLVAAPLFLLAAVSWLITLRPEPIVALCATLSLCAAVAFEQERSFRWLFVAAVATAVSVTIHPVGLVAAAPVIAMTPTLVNEFRGSARQRSEFLAIGFAAAALGLIALLLDTDVTSLRSAGEATVNPSGLTYTWRDAIVHYQSLFGVGNAPRRLTLLIPVAAVVAYASRLDRTESPESRLPARAFVVALLLMLPSPSKWLWHFGALSGLGVVVAVHEWERLRRSWLESSWPLKGAVLVGGVALFAIGWRGNLGWLGQTDLTAFGYDARARDLGFLPVDLSSIAFWVGFSGMVLACVRAMSRFGARSGVPLTPAALWTVPTAALLSASLVIGLLVDSAVQKSPEWSLPSQLVESISGSTCGLADDLLVIEPAAATTEFSVDADSRLAPLVPASAPPAPPQPFARASTWNAEAAPAATPWFAVPSGGIEWSVAALGPIGDGDDRPYLQVGVSGPEGITEVTDVMINTKNDEWVSTVLAAEQLGGRDRLRVIFPASGTWWVSGPYRETGKTMTDYTSAAFTWVSPFLRFQFPCFEPVPIENGVATVPHFMVDSTISSVAGDPTSPLAHIADVAQSHELFLVWRETGLRPPVVTLREYVQSSVPSSGSVRLGPR